MNVLNYPILIIGISILQLASCSDHDKLLDHVVTTSYEDSCYYNSLLSSKSKLGTTSDELKYCESMFKLFLSDEKLFIRLISTRSFQVPVGGLSDPLRIRRFYNTLQIHTENNGNILNFIDLDGRIVFTVISDGKSLMLENEQGYNELLRLYLKYWQEK